MENALILMTYSPSTAIYPFLLFRQEEINREVVLPIEAFDS